MQIEKQLIECIPNFSEGRNSSLLERIVRPFQEAADVRLLNCQHDEDHNRTVVTVVGTPETVAEAVIASAREAVQGIDMKTHRGGHPRMGAVDVVPFVPVRHITMEALVTFSRRFAERFATELGIPVFLYEASATHPARIDLAAIRKGEFEGMASKMKQAEWQPDFGPNLVHPTAGVTAIGARKPLVAFNVNLATHDLSVAKSIAATVRHQGGGLRYCKAVGIALEKKGITQVSMNLTDFSKTAIYRALELVRMEAGRYGVAVTGTEIVGLTPMAALVDAAAYYLQLRDFSIDQVLEAHLLP